MADIDKMLDQHIADTFKALPPRKMYGQTYENIPRELLNPKAGDYSLLYNIENDAGAPEVDAAPETPGQRHYHTLESPTDYRLWRLKQFLGS